MNLIEAVKSGKRFSRRGNTADQFIARDNKMWRTDIPNIQLCPSNEDLLADDWEIEERSVEVTRSRIEKVVEAAWRSSLSSDRRRHGLGPSTQEIVDLIIRELGLDDAVEIKIGHEVGPLLSSGEIEAQRLSAAMRVLP